MIKALDEFVTSGGKKEKKEPTTQKPFQLSVPKPRKPRPEPPEENAEPVKQKYPAPTTAQPKKKVEKQKKPPIKPEPFGLESRKYHSAEKKKKVIT